MEERIYLRALEIDDYKISIKWRKDDQIWNMLGGPKYFVSEAYEKKWVEDTIFNSKDVKLAICLIENDKYIGNVYMTDIDEINRSCNSHVLIGDKNYWGKGYAREALLKAIKYMFEERNIHRIQANVLESNELSLKMHKKCGYKVDGLLRDAVYKSGRYQNQYVLSLLKEEFLNSHTI
ncbi:GNAT family N-acetyltransferase [Xylanibacter rarus]|uniref:GNAT family N-acetyltransferase n=1 Tax=Xylanibacter rarus TaxID=1676614 RepID=UPI003AB91AA1